MRAAVHGHAEFLIPLASYDRNTRPLPVFIGTRASDESVVHDATSYQLRLDNTGRSVQVDRVRLRDRCIPKVS